MNSKILGSSLILEFDVDQAVQALEEETGGVREGNEKEQETDVESGTTELDPSDEEYTNPSTLDLTAESSQTSSLFPNKGPTTALTAFQSVFVLPLIPEAEMKQRIRFHERNLQQGAKGKDDQGNRSVDHREDDGVGDSKAAASPAGSKAEELEHVSSRDPNRALIKRESGDQRERSNSSLESVDGPPPPALLQQQQKPHFSSQSLLRPSTPEATSSTSLISSSDGQKQIASTGNQSELAGHGSRDQSRDRLSEARDEREEATDPAAGRVGRVVRHGARKEAGDEDDEGKGERRPLSGAEGDRKSRKNAAFPIVMYAPDRKHESDNSQFPFSLDRNDSSAGQSGTRRECKQGADGGEDGEDGRRRKALRSDDGNHDRTAEQRNGDSKQEAGNRRTPPDRTPRNNLLHQSEFMPISAGLNGQNADLNEIRDQMRQAVGQAGQAAIREEETAIVSEFIDAEDLRIRGTDAQGGYEKTSVTPEVFPPSMRERPLHEVLVDRVDHMEKRLSVLVSESEQKLRHLREDMDARIRLSREEHLTALLDMRSQIVATRGETGREVIEKVNILRDEMRREHELRMTRLEQRVEEMSVAQNILMNTPSMNTPSDMERITKLEAAVHQQRQAIFAPKHAAADLSATSLFTRHQEPDPPVAHQTLFSSRVGAPDADSICGQISSIKSQQELLRQQVLQLIHDMQLIRGEQRNAFNKLDRAAEGGEDRHHEADSALTLKATKSTGNALHDPRVDSGVEKRRPKQNPARDLPYQVSKGSQEEEEGRRRSSSNDIFNGRAGENFRPLQKQKTPAGRRIAKGNKRPLPASKLGRRTGKVLRRVADPCETREQAVAGRYCMAGDCSESSSAEASVSMGSDCETSCQTSSIRRTGDCRRDLHSMQHRLHTRSIREQGSRSCHRKTRDASIGFTDAEKSLLPSSFLQTCSPIFRWKQNQTLTDVRRDSLSSMPDQPPNHITAAQFVPRVTPLLACHFAPKDIKRSSASLISTIKRTTARLQEELAHL